jgi:hypothetical protein
VKVKANPRLNQSHVKAQINPLRVNSASYIRQNDFDSYSIYGVPQIGKSSTITQKVKTG